LDEFRKLSYNDFVARWKDEHTKMFQLMKDAIKAAPFLCHPDFEKPFHLGVDGSYNGLGVCLFQLEEIRGVQYKKIVGFASRALTAAEKHYTVSKIELAGLIFGLKRFRPYITAKPLFVYTDHRALVALQKARHTSSMMTIVGQWFETLTEFLPFIRIIHISGFRNTLPDLLSRMGLLERDKIEHDAEEKLNFLEVESMDDGIDGKVVAGEVVQFSLEEKLYLNMIGKMDEELKESGDTSKLEFSVGIESSTPSIELEEGLIQVSDQKEKDRLLQEAHSMDHLGATSLIQRIKSTGKTWKTIRKDAIAHVKTCRACIEHSVKTGSFYPLRSHSARLPMDWLTMDLAGPLEKSNQGNRYILIAVDVCSRYIFLRAIPDKSAKTIAQELVLIMLENGVVKHLSSDNGTEFKNSTLKEIVEEIKGTHGFSSVYNPSSNGLSERHVGLTQNALKRVLTEVNEELANWDLFIPFIAYALNTRVTHTLGTTPFNLFFGRSSEMEDYTNLE
jgi:transposase InsO family protein